jgi:anti-anti-sigma regulatory factor
MLKITLKTNGQGTVLKLEGTLREPWVAELRSASQQARDPNHLALDLADVTYLDQSGIGLLRELLASGVRIAHCSGFVAASLGLEE